MRGMTISIHPGELIVGNRSPLPRMGVVTPSAAVAWIDRELDTLATRPQDPFDVAPEDIRELREEIFPYWRGHTLEDQAAAVIPPDVKEAIDAKVFQLNQTDHAQGHILPNVEEWLHHGPKGLWARAEAARGNLAHKGGLSVEQAEFYEAAEICLAAACRLHAALCCTRFRPGSRANRRPSGPGSCSESPTTAASSPRGRRETFGKRCNRWPSSLCCLQIESNASSLSPGRFDQYMIPYLRRDLQAERLTLPEAQELLECLWVKFNEMVLLRSAASARYFAGFPIGFNLIVGGQQADGQDATNALSFMCLEAQADVQMPQPNFSVRLHKKTPDDFLTGGGARDQPRHGDASAL